MSKAPKFIDVRTAIGDLVLNGIRVEATYVRHPSSTSSLRLVLESQDAPLNFPIFRDGGGWKVKAETVDDLIEDHKLSVIKESLSSK